jgi:Pretoxin HINT domain
LNHQNQIAGIVNDFLSTLGQLASGNSAGFASKLVTAIDNSLPLLLQFAASQLGLSNLPQTIQAAAQAIPNAVQKQLMTIITAIAKNLPLSGLGALGGSNNLFAGELAPMVQFTYQGIKYDLWVANDGSRAVVKLAVDSTKMLVGSLSAANFTGGGGAAVGNLQSDAQALANLLATVPPLSTTKTQTPPNQKNLATQQNLVTKITADLNQVAGASEAGQCGLLTGCFRADARLQTSEGWRRVDEIRPGERVAARDEADPDGAIEWKQVEAKFERTGRILELVANGQEIRTTPEHPFYVRGKGWTDAGALHAGDEVRTQDGWVEIEEVRDTGLYEKVYNVRVADFHTYFVGGDGFAVWAHNLNCGEFANVTPKLPTKQVQTLVANGEAALVNLTNSFPSLNIRSIVETQLLRNNGAYYDSAPSLAKLLNTIYSELKAGNYGTYNVLVQAANLIMAGHRVAIEVSASHGNKADLMDFTAKQAVQMKTVTSGAASGVVNQVGAAVNQLYGGGGENPPAGFSLTAWIIVTNASNPFAGFTTVQQFSQELQSLQFTQSSNVFSALSQAQKNLLTIRFVTPSGTVFNLSYNDLQPSF